MLFQETRCGPGRDLNRAPVETACLAGVDGRASSRHRTPHGAGTMAKTVATGAGTPQAVDRLIEEARRGSREALGAVIEAFRSHLVRVAQRELGRDLRAKASPSDVVQETL